MQVISCMMDHITQRECPKRKKLNAIMVNDNKDEETIMGVNPIRNRSL
jgi:hypothetical protein